MAALPPFQPRPATLRPRFRELPRWGALLFATLAFLSAREEVPKEYPVKAAFLYNFTKFVEWPAAGFPTAESPIVIAVLGRNPFGDELQKIVRDRMVNGRPIVVRLLRSLTEAKSATDIFHVLFVAAGEEEHLAALTRNRPRDAMLTVGESDRFAALGGMVNFVLLDNKVRFTINRAPAEAAGLKISAQLQKLALPPSTAVAKGRP